MNSMAQRLSNGERHVDEIIEHAEQTLRDQGLRPDGAICDADTLQPLTVDSQRAVILMAARQCAFD